jgi:hypothetical protein
MVVGGNSAIGVLPHRVARLNGFSGERKNRVSKRVD